MFMHSTGIYGQSKIKEFEPNFITPSMKILASEVKKKECQNY